MVNPMRQGNIERIRSRSISLFPRWPVQGIERLVLLTETACVRRLAGCTYLAEVFLGTQFRPSRLQLAQRYCVGAVMQRFFRAWHP